MADPGVLRRPEADPSGGNVSAAASKPVGIIRESVHRRKQTYDACVVDGHPDLSGSLFIGVDAAVRKDNAAVVCLKYAEESDQLLLADYKIWKPLPGQPINIEASVEFYLRRVYSNPNARIEKILVDPYQMARSAQTLQTEQWKISMTNPAYTGLDRDASKKRGHTPPYSPPLFSVFSAGCGPEV